MTARCAHHNPPSPSEGGATPNNAHTRRFIPKPPSRPSTSRRVRSTEGHTCAPLPACSVCSRAAPGPIIWLSRPSGDACTPRARRSRYRSATWSVTAGVTAASSAARERDRTPRHRLRGAGHTTADARVSLSQSHARKDAAHHTRVRHKTTKFHRRFAPHARTARAFTHGYTSITQRAHLT